MEKAILINRIEDLNHWKRDYTRIYFGNEFCERLIPKKENIQKMLLFTSEKCLDLTIVTPHLSSEGIARIHDLFSYLNELSAERTSNYNGFTNEVVLNDFGALELVNNKFRNLVPIWGRLFSKYFGSEEFMQSFSVRRLEFDSIKQLNGFKYQNKSFYYPLRHVANTRYCPVAGLSNKKNISRGIVPCNKECIEKEFWVCNPDITTKLLLKGNTQFLVQPIEEKKLEMSGVNRIIFEPVVP